MGVVLKDGTGIVAVASLDSLFAQIERGSGSNEREMLYIDIAPTDLAGPIARQTAA